MPMGNHPQKDIYVKEVLIKLTLVRRRLLWREDTILIIFRNPVHLKTTIATHVMARGSCRFLLVRLRRGRYLKYCYSIVNELEGRICPSIISAVGKSVLGKVFKRILILEAIFIKFAQFAKYILELFCANSFADSDRKCPLPFDKGQESEIIRL